MKLQISTGDAMEFVTSWKQTMGNKSYVQPYNPNRRALVFSFDGRLKPFLNYTKGYHWQSKKRLPRPYLAETPRVMAELRKLLTPYRSFGGRVFVTATRAYFVDERSVEHHLCDLKWPPGIDVVTTVKNLRRRRQPTLRLTMVRRRL